MTKFVLPLLVFACAGFSQGKDAPEIDPRTGLPISGKLKASTIAEKLADVLQGANPRERVGFTITFVRSGAGWPEFRDIEKLLVEKGVSNFENLAGKTSISELVNIISSLDLFITSDSFALWFQERCCKGSVSENENPKPDNPVGE